MCAKFGIEIKFFPSLALKSVEHNNNYISHIWFESWMSQFYAFIVYQINIIMDLVIKVELIVFQQKSHAKYYCLFELFIDRLVEINGNNFNGRI